jgi:hypothetical protein
LCINAEFQHFILRFNKMSLLCGYHWKRGYGVKEKVTLRITLICEEFSCKEEEEELGLSISVGWCNDEDEAQLPERTMFSSSFHAHNRARLLYLWISEELFQISLCGFAICFWLVAIDWFSAANNLQTPL